MCPKYDHREIRCQQSASNNVDLHSHKSHSKIALIYITNYIFLIKFENVILPLYIPVLNRPVKTHPKYDLQSYIHLDNITSTNIANNTYRKQFIKLFCNLYFSVRIPMRKQQSNQRSRKKKTQFRNPLSNRSLPTFIFRQMFNCVFLCYRRSAGFFAAWNKRRENYKIVCRQATFFLHFFNR